MKYDVLRGERLAAFSPDAADFISSVESDKLIIKQVIKINEAHLIMLVRKGIISRTEGYSCVDALKSIPDDISMNPNLEDVHMNIEALVIEKAGEAVGGQINLAKSRNDQVASAIRMTLRDYVLDISSALVQLRKTILKTCKKHINSVMPGYTHLQHAQPVTLAHHILAHHDALVRDFSRLMEAYSRVNLSPMGSCALATTSFDIDRKMVSDLLGFQGIIENSMDAVSTRDFALEILADIAILMLNLSRFAEELILWSTQEFAMVDMPDEYSSTSSIMPQKKNAVVAELIRAKTSDVYGDLIASLSIMKALPYSYNLDIQELTPHIWNSCKITLSSIIILAKMLEKVKFDDKRLLELVQTDISVATELADSLVKEGGISFRTAHRIAGILVKKALSKKQSLKQVVRDCLNLTFEKNTGRKFVIPLERIIKNLDPIESVKMKPVKGGPSPYEVLRMMKERERLLNRDQDHIYKRTDSLNIADLLLKKEISNLKGVSKD